MQLSWLQLHHTKWFKLCFDFVWCKDKSLGYLFPSKFSDKNTIQLLHRHTAVTIRRFQELGNKQQLFLIKQEDTSPSPIFQKPKIFPCLGMSI